MTTLKNVYLPAWVPWVAQLAVFPLWLWLTHSAWFGEPKSAQLGFGTWAEASFVLVVLSVYLFLMGYGKVAVHMTCDGDR